MNPTFSFYKPIDDIRVYCEIFCQANGKTEDTAVFDGERFLSPPKKLLVLLHGNGESGRIFASQTEDFCKEYTVMTVDSRGQGNTTAGNQPFSIDLLAEDLSELCDKLGIERFSLVGFSDGGNVAVTYAVRHPERVAALITAGANLEPQGIKTQVFLAMLLQYRAASMHKNESEEKRIKYELLSLMVNHPHISHRLLSNIDCPCLILDGQHDDIKKKHTDSIAEAIRGAKRVTVPNSGHNIFADNAAFVNREIMRFLSDVS